jgi:hypothetical protein
MSKVRFRVVSSSGSSPEHEATQLHVHSPHTRGWQSPQFCEYPQVTATFPTVGGPSPGENAAKLTRNSTLRRKSC